MHLNCRQNCRHRRLKYLALSGSAGLLGLFLLAGCVTAADEPLKTGALDKNTIVRIADRMREQGDLAMAAEFYQRAVLEDPANVAAYYGLASLHDSLGHREDAERAYREALRYDSHNPAILRDYAKLQLTGGNYAAAAVQYRAALAENSGDVKALNGLGVALDQLGDHRGAQDQYRTALAKAPEDMNAQNNLGMSLIMAGDYNGAIQQLAPAAESFKATSSVRQNLALAYAKAGQNQPVPNVLKPTAELAAPAAMPRTPVAASEIAPAGIAIAEAAPAIIIPPTRQQWQARAARRAPPPTPTALAVLSPEAPVSPEAPTPQPVSAIAPETAQISPSAPAVVPPLQSAWAEGPATPALGLQPIQHTQNLPALAPAPAAKLAIAPPEPVPPTPVSTPVNTAALPESPATATPVSMVTLAPPASSAAVQFVVAPPRTGGVYLKERGRASPVATEPAALRLPRHEPSPVFGPYATDQIAQGQQAALQQKLSGDLPAKAVLNIVTRLTESGTPEFLVQLYGFKDQDGIDSFCASAQHAGFRCQ